MATMTTGLVFLAAAVVAVPVFKRLKLGAILGYLVAGLVIGPSVLNLVSDPDTILHFAELGVVLLLFVIGLELEPQKLWRMRNQILLTGGGQLLITSAVILGLMLLFGFSLNIAIVVGLAVALSSTAFAIQLMSEHRILKTPPGQKGFSILLMQDLAVIPILLLVGALSETSGTAAPAWWVSVLAILVVLVAGRYFINPFLRLLSRYGSEEVMTAAALLIVMATAMGMQASGLSMGMGAFVAGMLLANSSFKHQLETEIEPFKGLLLGLFFIAIGMNLDLSLLVSQPLVILGGAVALVVIKAAVIFAILKASSESSTDAMRIALMLSQGGEFAFVVMAQASANNLLPGIVADQVTLVVGISMAMTAPLVILHSLWFNSKNCPNVYESDVQDDHPQVLIAGFGRFGQITARMLAAHNIPFTALDTDAEHIEFVKKYGNKVYFGDASRLDILKRAGIEQVKVLLIAVDNEEKALQIAQLVREEYPDIKVVARLRNRMNAAKFDALGITHLVREVFEGSIDAATRVLQEYGFSTAQANYYAQVFKHHDEEILKRSIQNPLDAQEAVQRTLQNRKNLESLFNQDKADIL
ncbi:monovalent cation:proton antiporter-2 (CPA2) family protein [Planctobacterium marinum]|uniref:monovalent cation:proton antiporter-2 (CPA2) family protein n=1 Tax=Planctobacterium marinum TaxID=1631968 RepID=UPI001E3974D6|nr:monovalent cation:proton antiporter-2 (CPA2) family protein [Planctobacterium marinum]MCC2605860.1 monovalent cation:proton antiporter-2 (CPA2) family protein [Planctobacterium marinum]